MKRKSEGLYIQELTAPFYEGDKCDNYVRTVQYSRRNMLECKSPGAAV